MISQDYKTAIEFCSLFAYCSLCCSTRTAYWPF